MRALLLLIAVSILVLGCQKPASPSTAPSASAAAAKKDVATVPLEHLSDEDLAKVHKDGKVGSYVGRDPCGLKIHTCDYKAANGRWYTEVIQNRPGMHAYNANPACQLVPTGNIGELEWRITAGYRVFPYSMDMLMTGTCPNCTLRIYCGTDAYHWTAVETDP